MSKKAAERESPGDAGREGKGMVIEQLLKEWIGERNAAADLAVAARSAKAIAAEIEGHFQEAIARVVAAAEEKTQLLGEKERSLATALDVISRLEGQLAELRDHSQRLLADRDRIIAERDRQLDEAQALVSRLESEFSAVRDSLEARIAILDRDVQERSRSLAAREDSLSVLEKEMLEKSRLIETYRKKFGVIMKAVG